MLQIHHLLQALPMLLILLSAGEGVAGAEVNIEPHHAGILVMEQELLALNASQGDGPVEPAVPIRSLEQQEIEQQESQEPEPQTRGFGHLLGVSLSKPGSRQPGNRHSEQRGFSQLTATLDLLQEIGFRIVEVGPSDGDAVVSYLEQSDYSVFVRQDRPFVTTHQLQQSDSLYIEEDLDLFRSLQIRLGEQLAAFSPFSYPDESSPTAVSQLDHYGSALAPGLGGTSLYYQSAFMTEGHPPAFDFRSLRLTGEDRRHNRTTRLSPVVHFAPTGERDASYDALESILTATLDGGHQSIIFLPLGWLSEQLESHPHMETLLRRYATDQTVIFPRPQREEASPTVDWAVVVLILLFGSYILHYHINSTYRNSLFRYFINRRFFAENTIQYRIRSPFTGITLLVQHTLLSALVLLILAETLLSPLGLEALIHRLPPLRHIPDPRSAVFLGGLILSGAALLLSSLWIQMLNSRTRFSQTLTLYMWPLQLNLPILFLMMSASYRGASAWWITLLFLTFLLIWFISFNLASLDIARALQRHRGLFRVATTGLSLVLALLAAAALLYYEPLSAPLRLALALP